MLSWISKGRINGMVYVLLLVVRPWPNRPRADRTFIDRRLGATHNLGFKLLPGKPAPCSSGNAEESGTEQQHACRFRNG